MRLTGPLGISVISSSGRGSFLPAIGPYADLARLNPSVLPNLTIDGVIYSATSTRTSPIQANHLNIINGGFLLGGNYQLWIRAGIIDVQSGCALASTNPGAGGGEINGGDGGPGGCGTSTGHGGSGLGGGGGGATSGSNCATETGGAGSITGYGDGNAGATDGADGPGDGGIGLHVNPWAGAPVVGYSIPIGGADSLSNYTVGPGIGQPGSGASVQGACGISYGAGGGAGNCCSVVQAVWIRTYGVNQVSGGGGASSGFITTPSAGAGDGGHLVIAQRFDGFLGAVTLQGGNSGDGGAGMGGELRLYAVNKAGTILTYMGADPAVSWNNM